MFYFENKKLPEMLWYWRWLNVSLSLSLSLSLCFKYPVSVSLPTDEPSRARPVENILALGRWSRISEENRTRRHHPHSSTTMQILGVPFLLFWLIWGHSCALGGKGRNTKKEKDGRKSTCFRNVWPLYRVLSLLKLARQAPTVRPTTSSLFRYFLSVSS